jgi:IS30 family transposase
MIRIRRRSITFNTNTGVWRPRFHRDLANHLNATPRKCLGYKTPAEVSSGRNSSREIRRNS